MMSKAKLNFLNQMNFISERFKKMVNDNMKVIVFLKLKRMKNVTIINNNNNFKYLGFIDL